MNYDNISENEYIDIVLKKISKYMSMNNIKQLDLSKRSNINQSTLSKIMNGESKLTLSHIYRICFALKIEPEKLLSFDNEISTEVIEQSNSGIISKEYLNDQILIKNTLHPAFKGYINEEKFFLYSYSTISSESSLLEGTITFEDTECHNFCNVTMNIFTGQTDLNNEPIIKTYHGELIISLTMGTCYCILINQDIGEICSLYFKHTFLFNQKLACRVATVISTSSGSNRLPIMQRALITDKRLKVNDINHPDFNFVRGQLKLNDSEIILSNDAYSEIQSIRDKSSGELKIFLSECIVTTNKFSESTTFYIFDETKIRSINVSSDAKAEGISILRNLSISPKYNKISTKTEEFTFQYINRKSVVIDSVE